MPQGMRVVGESMHKVRATMLMARATLLILRGWPQHDAGTMAHRSIKSFISDAADGL